MADLSAFNDYEREFLSLTTQLQPRISQLLQYTTDADQANAEIKRIDSDLMTAKQRLNDMQVEARGLSEPTRRELGNKISMYRTNLDKVSADLGAAKSKFQRSALMAGGRPLEFDKSVDQRQRMMNTTDKLRGGTDTLNDAHRRLEETIEVGEGITASLQENRETMMRIRGKVGTVSGALDEARRILRSMSRREVRTKVAVGIFAVLMIAIIIGLIVWVTKDRAPQ